MKGLTQVQKYCRANPLISCFGHFAPRISSRRELPQVKVPYYASTGKSIVKSTPLPVVGWASGRIAV
jgi:hypothetical protein